MLLDKIGSSLEKSPPLKDDPFDYEVSLFLLVASSG